MARRFLLAALVIASASYGCQGGCGAAQIQPLAAPLPADQIIEGGVQMRLTGAGMGKLESALPDLLAPVLAGGVCVPEQRFGTIGIFASLTACSGRDCAGGAQGCNAQINLASVDLQLPDGATLTADTRFDITNLPMQV